MDDLDAIYIRAKNKHGKWGSYSLRELLADGVGGQIGQWYAEQCLRAVGVTEGAVITQEMVTMMMACLETIGIPLVRLRESSETQP